jgi:hypothetical protein
MAKIQTKSIAIASVTILTPVLPVVQAVYGVGHASTPTITASTKPKTNNTFTGYFTS